MHTKPTNLAFAIYIILFSSPLLILSGPLVSVVFALTVSYILYHYVCNSAPGARYKIINDLTSSHTLWATAMLLIWIGLTSFWSLDPARSIKTVIKVFLISSAGFISLSCLRYNFTYQLKINKKVVLWLIVLINIFIMSEHMSGYAFNAWLRAIAHLPYDNIRHPGDKGMALLTLLMPVLCVYLYEKSWQYLLLSVVLITNLLTHPLFAAPIAILCAIFTMLIARLIGQAILKIFFMGVILLLIFTPLIFPLMLHIDIVQEQIISKFPYNWLERLEMWDKSVQFIRIHPIIGWGLNADNSLNSLTILKSSAPIQMHPHNSFVQIWLETGAIGVAVLSFLLFFIYQRLLYLIETRKQLIACSGSVAVFWAFSMVSFNLWQSWWLCSLWLLIIVHYILFISPKRP